MEKALIEGSIQVSDLPKLWTAKMSEYLGCEPESDARGVLQDVHWSAGLFGYFPTYRWGWSGCDLCWSALAGGFAAACCRLLMLAVGRAGRAARGRGRAGQGKAGQLSRRIYFQQELAWQGNGTQGAVQFPNRRCTYAVCCFRAHSHPTVCALLTPPMHAGSLGAMYACQIYKAAEADLPGLSDDIAAGKFGRLKLWLNEKIHR